MIDVLNDSSVRICGGELIHNGINEGIQDYEWEYETSGFIYKIFNFAYNILYLILYIKDLR